MQYDKSSVKGWWRPHQMCSIVKKTFEVNEEKRIIRQVDNHTLALDFAQDIKHTQCKSKDKLKMMLGKNWPCNIFLILSWVQFAPLFANYSKGGKYVIATEVRMMFKKLGTTFHPLTHNLPQPQQNPKWLIPMVINIKMPCDILMCVMCRYWQISQTYSS